MSGFSEAITMKIAKIPCLLLIALCVTLFFTYVTWTPNANEIIEGTVTKYNHGGSGKKEFYGIMFDAGSTGTRVHVYKFSQTSSGTPKLDHETFKAIKPGLSAYADEPEKCAVGIKELLGIAMAEIPEDLWKSTPLVLKATAGLRLLPGEKAQKLLDTVRDIFTSSHFLVGKDSVSIMNGTDEGIFAWITVNFLIGSLTSPSAKLVGMLDLGGGSTQITFYPYDKSTFTSAPPGYITTCRLFNHTHHLYSHSYLGLGLMSARLEIMGGKEGIPLPPEQELVTPCVTPGYVTEFQHAGITYKVKGEEGAVTSVYESCYKRVGTILQDRVNHVREVAVIFFYAFSYYFDLAEDTNLIDPNIGGFVKVKDFEMAAQKECTDLGKSSKRPFICMDLCYITHLLHDLGFPKEKRLKLVKKINDVETSWALGATFYYMSLMQGDA